MKFFLAWIHKTVTIRNSKKLLFVCELFTEWPRSINIALLHNKQTNMPTYLVVLKIACIQLDAVLKMDFAKKNSPCHEWSTNTISNLTWLAQFTDPDELLEIDLWSPWNFLCKRYSKSHTRKSIPKMSSKYRIQNKYEFNW